MQRVSLIAMLVAFACVAPAAAASRPAKPRVLGPRRTSDRTPSFRFVSREPGVASRTLRFRCTLSARFRSCPRRFTPRLRIGRHVLRVRAVDPAGRTSSAARVVVRVVAPAPRAPHPDQTIRVGTAPYNVAYGFGSLWVAVSGGLVRLAPSGSVEARIDLGGRPWGLVIADGAVWVGNQFTQTVDVVDPRTNALARRFPLPGAPVGVALGGGSLWAADNYDDQVWRVNPATGAILATLHIGDRHEFVGFSEGRVWVASEDGTIAQLDPSTGAVVRSLAVGSDSDYLGFAPGAVWVSNYTSPLVLRLDAATGAVAQQVRVGFGAQAVADDGSRLWVAKYNSGTVLEVDRASGKVLKRFQVGDKPRGLTIALGSVWVANSASGTVSRIALSR